MDRAAGRVFLFLQGPHGPFVRRLARRLASEGGEVRRVAFNPADEAEWRRAGPIRRYQGPADAYESWIEYQLVRYRVTDIILYGDSRPEHAAAIHVARRRGVLCHCLEEGYLRPEFVTYERWGSNGNSRLRHISASDIERAIGEAERPAALPSDGWGAHRAHIWHSARYHGRLLLPSRHFGRPPRRRDIGLWHEFSHYTRRTLGLPWRRFQQGRVAASLLDEGCPYHLALLQLSFDASMQAYSDYKNSASFIGDCIRAFAEGASPDDRLVFKSHPFEDGRERLRRVIRRRAAEAGVARRVLFLDGVAVLGTLLDNALSTVTINSTAAQQALWRGLPVAARGRAVYARPGLVSDQPLEEFFAAPRPPDMRRYWQFRSFLTRTSQIRGSFYSGSGIREALEALPAAILAPEDPYDRVLGPRVRAEPATPRLPAQKIPERIAV
ncbi:MAG: capsule biosynthesis protein CapA [Paracoccaceae bacterium]|nr:capsule biosynthesis protein CapA [Paracoccaceae bacterium]